MLTHTLQVDGGMAFLINNRRKRRLIKEIFGKYLMVSECHDYDEKLNDCNSVDRKTRWFKTSF